MDAEHNACDESQDEFSSSHEQQSWDIECGGDETPSTADARQPERREAVRRKLAFWKTGGGKGKSTRADETTFTKDAQRRLVHRALGSQDQSSENWLPNLRARADRDALASSTVEVRFERLNVTADTYVGARAMPTLINAPLNIAASLLTKLQLLRTRKHAVKVLDDVSGIIPPGRMTLLLGPPSAGKTTLLKALGGRLNGVQQHGDISYNGENIQDGTFKVAQTANYVEEVNNHMGEMSVRETIDFAACCQGAGSSRKQERDGLCQRAVEAVIDTDPEMSDFLEAEAHEGKLSSVGTEHVLRVLGLDVCSNIPVGNEMIRGISGGQKKRLTTGEMLVGPQKVFLLDGISTGLDSDTTYRIVKYLRDFTHSTDATVVVSLLQPPPEVFNLFDDILLLAEGKLVYHGPRAKVIPFFEGLGFRAPTNKATADFLQEVTSRTEQQRFWMYREPQWRYISVVELAWAFQQSQVGLANSAQLLMPFSRDSHQADDGGDPLMRRKYVLSAKQVLQAVLSREWMLMKRNAFLHIFRLGQALMLASVTATLFLKPRMNFDTVDGGVLLTGAIFFSITFFLFEGLTEVALTIERLPVYYKQFQNRFFPSWSYVLSLSIMSLPLSIVQACAFSAVVYFGIGLTPEPGRFFIFVVVLLVLHQWAVALFRAFAAFCRSINVTNTFGSFVLLVILVMGGYVLTKPDIKPWWIWAYYLSPVTHAQNALTINEFSAARWQVAGPHGHTVGDQVMRARGVPTERYWVPLGIGVLLAWAMTCHILTWLWHAKLGPLKRPHGMVTNEHLSERKEAKYGIHAKTSRMPNMQNSQPHAVRSSPLRELYGIPGQRAQVHPFPLLDASEVTPLKNEVHMGLAKESMTPSAAAGETILPFETLSMSFLDVHYYVPIPKALSDSDPDSVGPRISTPPNHSKPMLEPLSGVTGCFRPGVLTALMGVSGAGKTTLLDVLAGRKTGGLITGEITINGYAKRQNTFARLAGYVEQFDVHSPLATVEEALLFSSRLRIGPEFGDATIHTFVEEVMELVELAPLSSTLVGEPGISGLSAEQRRRLTIAVELVANPSIIFMDEPTSGLDARAANIVMRAICNTVKTQRTVVCTIHQPSSEVFELFDELLLLQRGGDVIYNGPLGQQSRSMLQYFEAIPGVTPLSDGVNPATWVLEITSPGVEPHQQLDFASQFESSTLARQIRELVAKLNVPREGSRDFRFTRRHPQPVLQQLRVILKRNFKTYWRRPAYNGVRFFSAVVIALLLGSIFWQIGDKTSQQQDVINLLGSLYAAILFIGFLNCLSVQPIVGAERSVFFRERAAGYYAVLPFSVAQIVVELCYNVVQVSLYSSISFFMIGFEATFIKFAWYWLNILCVLVLFTNYGIMAVALCPNVPLANVLSSCCFGLWNVTAGFVIPKTSIPSWWIWLYYINPIAWGLYGVIVTQLGNFSARTMQLLDGHSESVTRFLDDTLGYKYHMRGWVIGILLLFATVFAVTSTIAQKVLVYQKR